MEKEIGKITHYFNRINVAVLALSDSLRVGDIVHILGHTTDFTQRIGSMEINHQKVESVIAGSDVAIKVEQEVRAGDTLFKVIDE